MAPKRRSSHENTNGRSTPYDMNMSGNWTVSMLKVELDKLGIEYSASDRKAVLIMKYKERSAVPNQTDAIARPASGIPTRRKSPGSAAAQENAHGQGNNKAR